MRTAHTEQGQSASNSWAVPLSFVGGTVAILASGPSMSQEVADAVHAAGVPAIAVNTTFRLAPWAWMVYAADAEWWEHPTHRDVFEHPGLKVTIGGSRRLPGVHALRNTGADGFDPEPGCVRTGSNSGYQAVHIAAQAGARRILLCGFDMHGGHWHGDHPHGLRRNTTATFEKFRARFTTLVRPLRERGIDVVNVTPGSRLDCFRRGRLEDELAACAEHVAREPALPA